MRRRALLASLGSLTGVGSTAGCLGTGGTTPGDTPTPIQSGYRITDLSVSTDYDRPEHRFVLKARMFASAEAVEQRRQDQEVVVMDVADVENPASREALRATADGEEWRSNALPEGLDSLVERVDFFTGLDGRAEYIGFELYRFDPDAPPAIEFTAEFLDDRVDGASPGALSFVLTNTSGRPQSVFSGTVPPFGILWAERVGSGARFLLWREYENEGCVQFTDDGVAVCDIGIITELGAGDTLTRRYEVLPGSTVHYPARTVPGGPGTYRVSDSLSFRRESGAPSTMLTYEVRFRLER